MSSETRPTTKAAQSEATRTKLLAAARGAVRRARDTRRVGTEEIVRTAGVTRGALYHQFADKRELFEAVFEQVEAEMIEVAARAAWLPERPTARRLPRAAAAGWRPAGRPRSSASCCSTAPPSSAGRPGARSAMRYGLGRVGIELAGGRGGRSLAPQPVARSPT